MCTVLRILVLRYVHCAAHTGAYICVLCWVYWCLDMCTVLGILVLRYVPHSTLLSAQQWPNSGPTVAPQVSLHQKPVSPQRFDQRATDSPLA